VMGNPLVTATPAFAPGVEFLNVAWVTEGASPCPPRIAHSGFSTLAASFNSFSTLSNFGSRT
jgi:hypothetical protein